MPKKYVVRYERSPTCRIATIDNSTVTVMNDKVGSKVSLSLARLDVKALSEEALQDDNGAITLIPNAKVETEFVKSIEFIADMRPDHALALLAALRLALGQMPADLRGKYNIDDGVLYAQKSEA